MDGNKDDSEKCLRLAEKYIRLGDREKAIKFLNKAERLYPSKRAKGMNIQYPYKNDHDDDDLALRCPQIKLAD